MRIQTTLIQLLGASLLCASLAMAAPTEDEALAVRRIVELWKDEEFDLAKRQMREFFQEHPNSSFKERLLLVAGDQEWRSGHYAEALSFYDQITSEEAIKQIYDRKVDALYRAKEYARLLEALKGNLPPAGNRTLAPAQVVRLFQYGEALANTGKHREAIATFARIFDTALGSQAKLAAANSYVALDEPTQAIPLYLALAEELPDKREALLLRAAQLQASHDPDASLTTLGLLKGHNSTGGTFSQVFLLFQSGRYQELWERRNALTQAVPADQQSLLSFFLGRTAFALGQYDDAVDLLKPLLADPLTQETPANDKMVLALLVASAQKLERFDWANAWIAQFEQKYPGDATLERLLLGQAELFRSQGKLPQALALLDQVLDKASASEERERASFQRVGILFDLGLWSDSHQAAEDFLATFPSSTFRLNVIKAKVQASAKELENPAATPEEQAVLQNRLVAELTELLQIPRALTPLERPSYLLRLAKVAYAQKNFNEAKSVAYQLIQEYPKDKQLYQAHLVLAYSFYENNDLQPFIRHAEAALTLRPDMPDQDTVKLNLFAAYVEKARQADDGFVRDDHDLSRAADLLYSVLERRQTPVRPENLAWLAKFYYSRVLDDSDELTIEPLPPSERRDEVERALKVLQAAGQDTLTPTTSLDDALMLSQLYGRLGLIEERRQLLEDVLARQWMDSPQNRQRLGRVHLVLAEIYQRLSQPEKAIGLYQHIIMSGFRSDFYTRDYAQLQLARLRFNSLSQEERQLENPDVQALLQNLYTLQVRRSLISEPIHLEAAWERAHIMADLSPEDQRREVLLNSLKQAKRMIVSQDDITSRDYHASREEDTQMDRIYQAYLMLFDARIAQVEAEIAGTRKHIAEQKSKRQAAKTLYSTLSKGTFAVTPYLLTQAQAGLDQLQLASEQ